MKRVLFFQTKLQASFTIEATVIIPLSLVILCCILFFGFYMHDQVTLKAEGTLLVLANAEACKEKDSENVSGSYAADGLLSATDGRLALKQTDNGLTVDCQADIHYNGALVRSILGAGAEHPEAVISITHLDARKELLGYKAAADGVALLNGE